MRMIRLLLNPMAPRQRGFALVELTLTLLVVAALSIYATSKVVQATDEAIAEATGVNVNVAAAGLERYLLFNRDTLASGTTTVSGVGVLTDVLELAPPPPPKQAVCSPRGATRSWRARNQTPPFLAAGMVVRGFAAGISLAVRGLFEFSDRSCTGPMRTRPRWWRVTSRARLFGAVGKTMLRTACRW